MSADLRPTSAHPQAGPSRPRSPPIVISYSTSDQIYHPIPASQAEDYDDLLIGLGSDDMNDFGLDDEDEDEDVDSLTPPEIGRIKGGRGVDVFDGEIDICATVSELTNVARFQHLSRSVRLFLNPKVGRFPDRQRDQDPSSIL